MLSIVLGSGYSSMIKGRLPRPFCPPGKSAKACPALRAKVFRFNSDPNQRFNSRVSPRMRGGSRSSRTLWWDAVDAAVRGTKRIWRVRRSRVVPMPRRWHQARDNACRITRVTVAKEPGHRGEPEGNRKAIVRGVPEWTGEPVVTAVCLLHFAHGLRVHRTPGSPCALT